MTPVRFLRAADLEFLRELAWYGEARPGAGLRFNAAVKAAVHRAAAHPLGGAPCAAGTRLMRVKGFPFSVVYRASPDELLVVAIAPHRKRPLYWLTRLD